MGMSDAGQPVAVKIIKRALAANPRAVERFLLEASLAHSLHHPSLVPVLQTGVLEDGRPYMVMPLLHGVDCRYYAELHEDLSPRRVASLLSGAASGLDAMHEAGLAHRDVKPENLFVRYRDDEPYTVVLDFGLAAFLGSGTRLTEEGVVVGTPEYLPPECANGAKAGIAADVYSLAVVAYEMIVGRLPFEHESKVVLLGLKMQDDAPAPSKALGRRTPALDRVFETALSRDSTVRPQSCAQLIDQLADCPDVPPRTSQLPTLPPWR